MHNDSEVSISMIEKFNKALQSEDKLTNLVSEVKQLRKEGHSKEQILASFVLYRETISSESDEDVVLEIMDFLTGFCSPHLRIE